MKNKFSRTLATALLAFSLAPFTSCVGDLDQTPSYEPTTENVYKDPTLAKQALARLYATMAVSGQQGPAGQPDIQGIDEGFSNYLRQYWMAQELTTDEAILAWESDLGVPEYNRLTWNASHPFVRAMYDRIFYQISLCNEFIRQTTDSKLDSYGLSDTDKGNFRAYRGEARFLRALSYYHALDMFGNVPFATETSEVGIKAPQRIERAALFDYVEKELKEMETELPAPRTNEFGRADQAAAWMVLAKLYLNANVYNGSNHYTDAVTYTKKIIGAGYTLAPSYANLFRTDNSSTSRSEIILPVRFDGVRTKTFGGMTFIIHASVGGSMAVNDFGIDFGWGGTRTKKNLVNLFPTAATVTDKRSMFYSAGQSLEINDPATFTDGYGITKFRNVSSANAAGSDKTFPDTDFPMFRLADVYLMYAEAVLRGGTGGDAGTALGYVNALRQRAYGNTSGNITAADLNLNFLLDERARELYWEGHRRTDLIRFGKYTTGYNWPFKGNVRTGTDVAATRTLFPIPTTDLTANPNLKQNPGY
ncbi:RagB/SusD family nutrient uptake outer membrane protein [Hymenobacter sp. HSC-4F20]|uniref:RagB/SusD family nutrient uptake outer membrane protein n=1 Tax=Hymenobacter sp. HSC-4F20 TaxID=2864135 RepID=UPI001C73DDD3|nr:RagB/SusD family nutrient uptake outer membrane protein [Hymenobacter sp. HSC-4F20]MBX0290236.1 RagB/SusD family nutrient uptake outer membrane protein [Hymenobacter sp. HSC-4F20]